MYYPKSQIKSNLYTNGGEFVYINTKDSFYTGYYYEISTGKKYTGKSPNSGRETEITPIDPSEPSPKYVPSDEVPSTTTSPPSEGLITLDIYGHYTLPNFNKRSLPTPYHYQPTIVDIANREYQRYFAKKTNELIYIEISIKTYLNFSNGDPKFATDLYEVISLPWSLGEGAESTNRKIVALMEKNNKWYGFSKYKGFKFGSRYTQGGEFRLPNGSNYIGPYHIMSNGTPMTGVSHGGGGDITLTSISSTSPSMGSSGGGY